MTSCGCDEQQAETGVGDGSDGVVVDRHAEDAEQEKTTVDDDHGDEATLAHERGVHRDENGEEEDHEDGERGPLLGGRKGNEEPDQAGEQDEHEPVAVGPSSDPPQREAALGREERVRRRLTDLAVQPSQPATCRLARCCRGLDSLLELVDLAFELLGGIGPLSRLIAHRRQSARWWCRDQGSLTPGAGPRGVRSCDG